MCEWLGVCSVTLLALGLRLGQKLSRAGQVELLALCPTLLQLRQGSLHEQTPASMCRPLHSRLCSSPLWLAPQTKHLNLFLGTWHDREVALCPRLWHLEHWTRVGLSTHFSMRISFPNSAWRPKRRDEEMDPSGSETANVIDE